MSRNTKTVLALLAAVLVLAVVPFFLAPGAEFGGSDDAGSRMVEEIQGEAYEPWFTPVLETLLGGELPERSRACCFASRQAWAWACWPTASAILPRVKNIPHSPWNEALSPAALRGGSR